MPTTTPPAATWGTEPNPTRPAAPPAARQPGATITPPAAPAPGATLAPPVQPMAKPAAPAAPVAPAPASTPAPAQSPMVPAYVAKAMERQRAKEEKENAMVPAPGTGAPAPTEPAAPLARQSAAPAARAASVTPAQPVTPPATEQQPVTPVAPEPSASGVTPPTAEDAPEVVAAKTEAEQTFADLMAKAQEWMNAKEDPASKLAFSQAITQSALVNQEAMNAVRGQIAANPALAGQPAGDALLALRASQIGTTMADLKGRLAIEEQREISRLNQLGFEATMKLNEIRKTEDERNLASFGSVLDEMIRGGADEATLEEFFNSNIKPLLPGGGAGMALDQFRNAGTRAQLLQGHRSETQRMLREAIASNADQATINQLVSAAYTEDQLSGIGKDWLTGKSLEEVNQVLRDAGYEEIEDLSELIGNEDLIGQAKIVADNKAQINRKPYQDEVDSTLQTLTDSGVILTPELEADVKAYIIRQSLPGADTSELPPWQDDVTAHLYGSWPLPGQTGFGPSIQDTPTSHSAYARNEALNDAWEAYLRRNPDDHVTREEWYNAQSEAVKSGGVTGAALEQSLREQSDPKKRVAPGDLAEAEARNMATKKQLLDTKADVTEIDFDDPDVVFYMENLPALLPGQIGNAKKYAKDKVGEWINYGGNVYRIEDGTQRRYYRRDRHRDFMTLTAKDGSKLYVGSDGRTTTTPPPSGPIAFGAWYDSMTPAAPQTNSRGGR